MEPSDNSINAPTDSSPEAPTASPAPAPLSAVDQRHGANDTFDMRRDLVVSLATAGLAEHYGDQVRIELLESIVADQFDLLMESGAFERQMVTLVENLATARVRRLASRRNRAPKRP